MDQDAEVQEPLVGQRQQRLKDLSKDVRMGFVRKVYGILCAQLLLTVAIATPLALSSKQFVKSNSWILYVTLGAMLACMCVMICASNTLRKFPYNYVFLFIFTCVMSVMVGFTSAMYTWQSVLLAAGAAVLVFVLLTGYAWFTTTDFTGYGPYLFAGMMVLFAFGFIISIMSFCGVQIEWMIMLYNVLGVLLFCFYIVFDTQCILGEWKGHKVQFGVDDYAFAALNLYLDIINLFLYLLSLFGERR
jgi:hypothetical protein